MEVEKAFKVVICLMLMTLCIGGVIYCVRELKDAPKAPDPMQKFNSCVEHGYTAYLDGEEVDPVKFDVTKYSVTYNDYDKVIYLTKREKSSGSSSLLVFLAFLVVMLLIWVPTRSR